ncbi:hypothetical protein ACA910_003256 [Epithemia clementina (nom. ined.)]
MPTSFPIKLSHIGSGILAIWDAQAGAKKMCTMNYTEMAKHAQAVMKANNISEAIMVIQAAVKSVKSPIEQDDCKSKKTTTTVLLTIMTARIQHIIIIEWISYLLLCKIRIDSLLRARYCFLKAHTGIVLPSHSSLYIAPISK